jgi:hypothetical protein
LDVNHKNISGMGSLKDRSNKMKKIVMTAAVLACAATVASAATVTSANIVGYNKTSKVAGGLQIFGVSFGEDSTIDDLMSVDQFSGSLSFATSDQIITWDASSQQYVTYGLFDGSAFGQPKEWRLQSQFFTGPSAGTTVLSAGTGIFVKSPSTSADVDVVISGEVPLAEFSTNSIVPGLQLMAMPYTATVDLNDTGMTNGVGSLSFATSDQVLAWDDVAQGYVSYGLFDGTPYGQPKEWRTQAQFFVGATSATINLGKGFWYNAQGSYDWVQRNPYFDNL